MGPAYNDVCQVVVLSATYQNADNVDQYDSSRGGNGREITRPEFPDRLIDLCEGIEEHEHNSGAQLAGTVYFPVTDMIDCETLSAGASVSSRMALP